MYDHETSVQPRGGTMMPWGGGPPMFCAIAARQPWIDRVSDRFFERSFEETFRRSVEAFRARERLGARAFGSAALGDPDFIEGLLRGDALGLDTVDSVLAFMGEAPLGPLFGCEVEAYLSIAGTGANALGLGAVGDGSFVRRLRAGHVPLLGTVDRVRRWMGLHSSAAQRRAIAAATLYRESWRTGVPDGPGCVEWRWADRRCTRAGGYARYLDTREAAEMMGLSPRTLEYYRSVGKGPAYYKLGGRVRYAVSEIERWVQARRRYSTRGDERAGPGRAPECAGQLRH